MEISEPNPHENLRPFQKISLLTMHPKIMFPRILNRSEKQSHYRVEWMGVCFHVGDISFICLSYFFTGKMFEVYHLYHQIPGGSSLFVKFRGTLFGGFTG